MFRIARSGADQPIATPDRETDPPGIAVAGSLAIIFGDPVLERVDLLGREIMPEHDRSIVGFSQVHFSGN